MPVLKPLPQTPLAAPRTWPIPRSRPLRILWIAAAGLALRIGLIFLFPIIFGSDSMIRLVNRDKILMGHQLPLLQACIWLLSRIWMDPLLIRLFVSAIGAAAAAAFYLLAADLVDETAAFYGALLFATSQYVVAVSIVPYQESLMLAGLFMAFHCDFHKKWSQASVWLGLACLTRFEAWIACPILAFEYARAGNFRPVRILRSALYFLAVPLIWIVAHRGLSPPGSFVVENTISPARLARLFHLCVALALNTPAPTLVLAALGALAMLRNRALHDTRIRQLLAFLILFAASLLFSAHGDPPDPERYIGTREAHIPIAWITLAAAFAFSAYPRTSAVLIPLGLALGVFGAFAYVRRETSRPEIRLGYEVARYLDRNMRPGERALVLAQPIELDAFFDKVRRTGGDAAVRSLQEALRSQETSPLDYQRILIHSRLGKDALWAYPKVPPAMEWIAAWSDFTPPPDAPHWQCATPSHLAASIRVRDRSVAIYRCD